MNSDIIITVYGRDHAEFGRKVEAIDAIARTPQELPPGPIDPHPPVLPPIGLPPIIKPPPTTPKPYFDIGDATGKPGDIVELSVEGGCRFQTNGFHIGGGCGLLPDVPRSGYGLFEATGATLGKFLHDYLKAHGAITGAPGSEIDHYWSGFEMAKHSNGALPEEWWQYAIGFFSLGQERTIPPIEIPSGTELFTLKIKILPETPPGEYTVTCLDEHYYTQSRHRRRDWLFTGDVSGGYTKLDLMGGKITVEA